MKKTRICDLLGIEYPIIQAPMGWISPARLAAAVSNAGGLGTIGPASEMEKSTEDPEENAENLRNQIRKARSLTSKPFAVNLLAVGERFSGRAISDATVMVSIEEKVPVAVVSMGSPRVYTKKLKEAGIVVFHAVASVAHAKSAEEEGVDAVIIEGHEGGGHRGYESLTTFVFIPMVADVVKIPVIAGGGIADARGAVAAFALGADALYMGTRFLASRECDAHPNMKQAVVDAIDTGTVSYGSRKVGTGLMRIVKNKFSDDYFIMEGEGASGKELRNFEHGDDVPELKGRRRVVGAHKDGNIELGTACCGQIAGMITEVLSVEEIIQNIVKGTRDVLAKLAE